MAAFGPSRADSLCPLALGSTLMNQMAATVWPCKRVHPEGSKDKDSSKLKNVFEVPLHLLRWGEKIYTKSFLLPDCQPSPRVCFAHRASVKPPGRQCPARGLPARSGLPGGWARARAVPWWDLAARRGPARAAGGTFPWRRGVRISIPAKHSSHPSSCGLGARGGQDQATGSLLMWKGAGSLCKA